MKKGIIILIILLSVLTFGIIELREVGKVLTSMENSIRDLSLDYEENENDIKVFYDRVSDIKEFWLEKEDWLCYLFNHRDLSVITDSINKLQVYTKNNDYDNAIAELALLSEYSTENCHIMGYNLKNVL